MLLLGAAFVLLQYSNRPPAVDALDPDRVYPGDVVSVSGSGFGNDGRLEIGGVAITHEAIRSWNDNLIVFILPETIKSGQLRVQNENGMSNSLFLTNRSDLPTLPSGDRVRVRSISRREVLPGRTVTVHGDGFGPRSPGSSLEFFYPDRGEEISFSGNSWWIVRWTDRRLEFVLPPEVPPGRAQLGINGEPLNTDLLIHAPAANAVYGAPQRYRLTQAVKFPDADAIPLAAIHVLIPRVPVLPEQPEVLFASDHGYRDGVDTPAAWVYRPEYVPGASDAGTDEPPVSDGEDEPVIAAVERIDEVVRTSVRWEIESTGATSTLLEPDFQRAFRRFLDDRDGVPVHVPEVREIRRASINLNASPLEIARAVHREVQRRLQPDPAGTSNLEEALQGAPATALVYADLAAALFRVSAFPARRHQGVLIADDGTPRDHAWVDVFLPDLGWVPMDPAVGDGMYGELFSRVMEFYDDEPAVNSFGALDGRRVSAYVDGVANPGISSVAVVKRPVDLHYGYPVLRLEWTGELELSEDNLVWKPPEVNASN